MAAVDSLLRLLASQNADALALASDQIPRLSRAGVAQPLSMPPVSALIMQTFVEEVLSPAQRAELAAAGQIAAIYPEGAPDGFTVQAKRRGEGYLLTFKRRSARTPAPPPATGPVAAPMPPPPPPGASLANAELLASASPAVPAPALSAQAAAPATAPNLPAQPTEVTTLVDRWLARVVDDGASDLVLSTGAAARLRIAGEWRELPGAPLDEAALLGLLEPAMSERHRESLRQTGSADLPLAWTSGGRRLRFRVNLFRQHAGLAAAFRPVRRHPPTLEELGLPASLRRLTAIPHGLVLVTGPTGAGKSTTLVALIEQLNREGARHVITLEDPIEYEYTPAGCMIHQREVGAHVDGFASGLRAALREAPDVILLGEMRDADTIAAAMTAAQTGHLVVSSLHAASAAMAVDRIVDVFPEHQQRQARSELAASLRAVLTQHLIPSTTPGERVPAIELLVATAATAAMIREDRAHQLASAIQTGRDEGMIPLERSLADLVALRRVELASAIAVTIDGGAQLREVLRTRDGRVPPAPAPAPNSPAEPRPGRPDGRVVRGPYR